MLARKIPSCWAVVPLTRNMPPNQVYMAAHGGIYGMHPGTGEASYRIKDEFEAQSFE